MSQSLDFAYQPIPSPDLIFLAMKKKIPQGFVFNNNIQHPVCFLEFITFVWVNVLNPTIAKVIVKISIQV